MKSKEPKANMFYWYWVSVILIFVGCMTAKKAERAITKFPEVAERILLNGLPRIVIRDTVTVTEIDSSGFEESVIAARNANAKNKQHIDILQARINSLSEGAKQICADVLLVNDLLVTENIRLNKVMSNIKPVKLIERKEFWFEDSLKIKLFRIELERKSDTLTKTKSELKTFKDKAKGNFTLYFPRWLLILIIILGGGAIFTKMKTGGLNPLKLLK